MVIMYVTTLYFQITLLIMSLLSKVSKGEITTKAAETNFTRYFRVCNEHRLSIFHFQLQLSLPIIAIVKIALGNPDLCTVSGVQLND